MFDIKNINIPAYSNFRPNDIREIREAVTATTSFWMLHNSFQRVNGFLTIHTGRSALITALFGLFSFTCASVSSLFVAASVERLDDKSKYNRSGLFYSKMPDDMFAKDFIRKFSACFLLFTLLEGRAFHSAIPSSLLSVGSFARTRVGSIVSTSPVATESQRAIIQKLGKNLITK